MTGRDHAIANAMRWFDSGAFASTLARRVACQTTSQEPCDRAATIAYLNTEMAGALMGIGCKVEIIDNPVPDGPPFLMAERIEDVQSTTLLMYGHGDVVRGYDAQWKAGLSPWKLAHVGERWYGRGTADNKGQHSINLAALEQVILARGKLGFNLKVLIEMGEEVGSPGLRQLCQMKRDALSSDVFIASDGPRLRATEPTLFLGSRGAFNFSLEVDLRPAAHHSGNWGGLLANPGTILASAIASLVDAHGVIRVPALRPPPISDPVRRALSRLEVGEADGPSIDSDWGEPGLTPAERVFGWNSLEVLAFQTGNPEFPVNAIPPRAIAHMQLRFVVGTHPGEFEQALRVHLRDQGLSMVKLRLSDEATFAATRLDPEDPWVAWVAASIERTVGRSPAILPNLGGSLPNDCFAEVLGLPTIWIPHSYPGCAQHAANEHLLQSVAREGLAMMVGLFWDLGTAAALEKRVGESSDVVQQPSRQGSSRPGRRIQGSS